MISKETLIKKAQASNQYKDLYYLAWARFLTYEELEKYDYLEAYDAWVFKSKAAPDKVWDKMVIKYTEDNIKKAMCVSLYQALQYFNSSNTDKNNIIWNNMNVEELLFWLHILEDHSFDGEYNDFNTIKIFYTNISKKYNFNLI